MLQLENNTPLAVTMAIFPDAEGIDSLILVAKATFEIGETPGPAEQPVPICLEDVYLDEPGASSLRYVSEMHLPKPGTDVVLVGQAWPERQKKVTQLDVSLAVAGREKTIRVHGDRAWKAGLLGASIQPAEPFESMPLVYERAYGGTHVLNAETGETLAEERNPVGTGFRGKRKSKEMDGQPVPNLEDPRQPLKSPGDEVVPACFGFVAPAWLPRRTFAGTYDEAWMKSRAPYLPEDFDPRFFQAAHPDLVFDRHLVGGEPVEAIHASPHGRLRFDLPEIELNWAVTIAGATERPSSNLETVLIEPDDDRFCMTWRAIVPCDKKALKIEKVEASLARFLIDGRAA